MINYIPELKEQFLPKKIIQKINILIFLQKIEPTCVTITYNR